MIFLPRLVTRLSCLGLLVFSVALAGVPTTLNYQGTLTDSGGAPVNGDRNITFRLYNVPTGGTAFWEGSQTVTLKDGRLSVVLGANSANPLDPKKFTGETYIGVQIDPDTEMPRQKFTSVAYAFNAGNVTNVDAIPKGVIVMWSGDPAKVPAGWALCDGSKGTPDLRDKFVMGAGGSLPTTGGTTSHTHSLPEHAHSITAEGDHAHHFDINITECIGDCRDGADNGSKDVGSDSHGHHVAADTWGAGAHSHGGQTGNGGNGTSGAADHLPPYYALAFIMKL